MQQNIRYWLVGSGVLGLLTLSLFHVQADPEPPPPVAAGAPLPGSLDRGGVAVPRHDALRSCAQYGYRVSRGACAAGPGMGLDAGRGYGWPGGDGGGYRGPGPDGAWIGGEPPPPTEPRAWGHRPADRYRFPPPAEMDYGEGYGAPPAGSRYRSGYREQGGWDRQSSVPPAWAPSPGPVEPGYPEQPYRPPPSQWHPGPGVQGGSPSVPWDQDMGASAPAPAPLPEEAEFFWGEVRPALPSPMAPEGPAPLETSPTPPRPLFLDPWIEAAPSTPPDPPPERPGDAPAPDVDSVPGSGPEGPPGPLPDAGAGATRDEATPPEGTAGLDGHARKALVRRGFLGSNPFGAEV